MKTPTMQKSDAVAFLRSHSLGSLATISPEGIPHVRSVYYACDESVSIYFLTLENTRKVEDIRANPRAAFTVTDASANQTIQVEGVFEEITDTATFGPILSELTARLFPEGQPAAPITHMDKARPVFFKLVPTWVRFGDFSESSTAADAFTVI